MKNKKFFISICLFIFCVFNISNIYAKESSQKVLIQLFNTTETDVHVNISEEMTKNPYSYLSIKEVNILSGQEKFIRLSLSENGSLRRTLTFLTNGIHSGYGLTGSSIEIDFSISTLPTIELYEVRIGDELWPLHNPFPVIKARLVEPKVERIF